MPEHHWPPSDTPPRGTARRDGIRDGEAGSASAAQRFGSVSVRSPLGKSAAHDTPLSLEIDGSLKLAWRCCQRPRGRGPHVLATEERDPQS